MADDTVIEAPSEGQPQENQDQTEKKGQDTTQSTTQKLEGKSGEELIKMYGELERKVGEMGSELGQKRQFESQMSVVLQAIYNDPDLTDKVKKEIAKVSGQKPQENKTEDRKPDANGDVRKALEGQIMNDFSAKYGLNSLENDKRAEVFKGIADQLADMVDPGGTKSVAEVLDGIDLTKLPGMLEKAYILADRDGKITEAANESMKKADINRAAKFGSISSSNGVSDTESLTPDEKETARKLGISEDKYLTQKKAINTKQ